MLILYFLRAYGKGQLTYPQELEAAEELLLSALANLTPSPLRPMNKVDFYLPQSNYLIIDLLTLLTFTLQTIIINHFNLFRKSSMNGMVFALTP